MGEQLFPGKQRALSQSLSRLSMVQPTVFSRQRMESGPVISTSLVGSGVRVEPVPPACFHEDQIHPAVTWEAQNSWDAWWYRALGRENTDQTQPGLVLLPALAGAPTSIHLPLHAIGETLGLCPQGLFILYQSIFSWRCVPFTPGALRVCLCVLQ